jgi:hypothetical protein
MGFLKRFLRGASNEAAPPTVRKTSFEQLTEEELEAHLSVDRYGDFLLSEAVRPSYDLRVVPKSGFRHDSYVDEESRSKVPVVMAAASRERVFEMFMDLLDPLGSEVDVVLETSHHRTGNGHTDLYREHIDLPVLKSILWDFEEMLLNDGCTGLAVLNPNGPLEVQFDEHKLVIVYGQPLTPFESILIDHGMRCDEKMKFITEAEHVHSSNERYIEMFEELKNRLGMDAGYDC